jgi:putative nucleotidyltransferase with HDIG domain
MTGSELLRILSRVPETRWPDAVIHHGARLALLLLLAVAASLMFPAAPVPDAPPVQRGHVLQNDVIAEIPFAVMKSGEDLAREQQEAAALENPIFVYDSTAVDSMLSRVVDFFGRIDALVRESEQQGAAARRVRDFLGRYNIYTDDLDLLLSDRMRARMLQTTRDVILDELPHGVARTSDLEDAGAQAIRLRGIGRDQIVSPDSIMNSSEFLERSRRYAPPSASAGYEQLQRLVLTALLVPSVHYDRAATQQARTRARAAVSPVKREVVQGERIVTAREQITQEEVETFRAYQQALNREGERSGRVGARTVGAFLFNLITLSLVGALLYFYRPALYRNLRHITLVAFLTLAVVATAAIIAAYEVPVILIPIAFPALVLATLWDGRLALNVTLVLAILIAGQSPFLGTQPLLTLVAGGAVASLSVRVVRRRAQTWSFIGLIGGGYLLISLVLGLLGSWTFMEIAVDSGWGAVSAVASAFAALGFLPLFEGYTRITTDQTLLELADANRPLLRRLSMEAPGTYAHSINVANLAEAAAGAIGANALLTRVGVYYHDVGKIGRPHYFIENQPGGRNPHDKLKPATSAQVVRNHVVEGMRLAEDAGLPDCVKAFITEHHGTQAISFFYDEARKADPEANLDPHDFAYPGPRPTSRETAIVMLADSLESAARVLPDPSPENIRKLVDRIVQAKMDAHQLDDTPLTLGELSRVKDQFVSVLTGMYHQRIDYPTTREREPEEPAAAGAGVDEPRSARAEAG